MQACLEASNREVQKPWSLTYPYVSQAAQQGGFSQKSVLLAQKQVLSARLVSRYYINNNKISEAVSNIDIIS